MNFSKTVVAPMLLVLLVSVAGCASTSTKESTGEYFDDTWITTKVKTALIKDPVVRATEVNVETFKGIVQLSGFVESEQAMGQAAKLASNVSGVVRVRNDLLVK